MFSIIPTAINVASGLALMGAVSTVPFIIYLNCTFIYFYSVSVVTVTSLNKTSFNRELSSVTWSSSTSWRRATPTERGSLKDLGRKSNKIHDAWGFFFVFFCVVKYHHSTSLDYFQWAWLPGHHGGHYWYGWQRL